MNASDAYLMNFLSKSNVCFEIPVYQRNYDWKEEHCRQLLEDITACEENQIDSYFIGSIVHIQERGPISVTGLNNIVIIDGQQRITTISLILLAIASVSKDKSKAKPIIDSYLLNPLQNEAGKVKLKPIKGDYDSFIEIITGKEPSISNTVGRNYKFIKDSLSSGVYDCDKILNGLGKLKIVEVALEVGRDNPQPIFESLNSTGMGLSHSDLVRNFILMSLSYEKQKDYYNKYLVEIEKNCNYKTAEFIRDFLIIKTKKIPSKGSVYKVFKQYALGDEYGKPEELLETLLNYSKHFSYIWQEEHPVKGVHKALLSIRKIGSKATSSYLMPLLKELEDGNISSEVVIKSIDLCESFIIRRSICELPSNALTKAFASLHREAKRVGDEWKSEYINYLMYVFGRKANKGRFPKNGELQTAILERNFYQFNHVIRNFILNAIENKNKKEKTNIQEGIEDGDLSIEHIMPQTLSKKWKLALGEGAKEIHEKYLNTIGNLTVTAFNSKISNKVFSEKLEQAFAKSPFWLNRYVAKQSEWDVTQIKERAKVLSKRVQELWGDVDRSLEYQTDELEDHVLADPIDVKYTNPVAIEINGNSYEALTYREVMAEFLRYLLTLDSTKLFGLQAVEKFKRCIVSEDPSELKVPYMVVEGVFTEGSASATTLVKNITRAAPHFGIELEDIVIVTHKERRQKFKMNKAA